MVEREKINALFNDAEFKQKANECKTMEDFYKLFNENGIEISMDETIEFISKVAELKEKQDNGELSEGELDEVAGGIVIGGALGILACAGIGLVCFGVAAGAAYVAYQGLRWAYRHN